MVLHFLKFLFKSKLQCTLQPTFQRRINVISTLWINVEITLIDVENETKSDVGFST